MNARCAWPHLALAGALAATACGSREDAVFDRQLRQLASYVDSTGTRRTCQPVGERTLFGRRGASCAGLLPDGSGVVERDAYGRVIFAARRWQFWHAEARWVVLRDSVMQAAGTLAGGPPSCATHTADGSVYEAWRLPRYDVIAWARPDSSVVQRQGVLYLVGVDATTRGFLWCDWPRGSRRPAA